MTKQPADWKTMEAGRMLDKAVVVAMGWHMEPDPEDPRYTNLIHRDGSKWPLFKADDPWSIMLMGNTIPHYSTDLNEAFMLFGSELGLEWNLFSEDDDWITCEVGHLNVEPPHEQDFEQATEKTPALAIVRAWLLWQEREDHPAPEYPKAEER